MISQITPHKVYEALKSLPDESLEKVWEFIEFVRYSQKNNDRSGIIKLGGILAEFDIDISEDDIAEARKEMWQHLGEIN
ncbi:MAG: hypothetical protein ACE5IR_27630 [bacterium]